MNGYYDETLEEIKRLIASGQYEDAFYMIRKELSMPYLPREFETILMNLKNDVSFAMSEKKEYREESLDSLLIKLKGKSALQLASAERLVNHNLRLCIKELQDYLSKDPCPEAAALIIDALAEQEIEELFEMTKNGVEYSFYPDTVIPVAKSEGFKKALNYAESLLYAQPAMLEMVKTVLIHKAYMELPLNIEVEESEFVVREIIKNISNLMDDGRTWESLK